MTYRQSTAIIIECKEVIREWKGGKHVLRQRNKEEEKYRKDIIR